jgi:uncharacterized protein (DUF2344 family)
MTASTRVNLAIPLDLAIQIEKECDKRGINRTQLIKEVLYEKIHKVDTNDDKKDIEKIKEEVSEIKKILLLLVEVSQNKKTPIDVGEIM